MNFLYFSYCRTKKYITYFSNTLQGSLDRERQSIFIFSFADRHNFTQKLISECNCLFLGEVGGVDLEERRDQEQRGGVEGGESTFRMYCMRAEKII